MTLATIAPQFPEKEQQFTILQEALKIAESIQRDSSRAEVLSVIVPHLDESHKLLSYALSLTQTISDESNRTRVLELIAPQSSSFPDLLNSILQSVEAIKDEEYRTLTLSNITGHLPKSPTFFYRALDITELLQNEKFKIQSISAVVSHLPGEESLLCRALHIAQGIKNQLSRAQVLIIIADHLPTPNNNLYKQALQSVRSIDAEGSKASALLLRDVAIHLFGPSRTKVLNQALEAAQNIKDEASRFDTIFALANMLPEVLPIALEAAQAIEDINYRAQALITLASKSPDVLPIALEAAQAIEDINYRAQALITLASKSPDVLPIALEAAQGIENISYRSKAFIALSDHLTTKFFPQALEAAQAIEDINYRSQTLITLADKIPEAIPPALEAAIDIQNEDERAKFLRKLADKLSQDLILVALEAASAIRYDDPRDMALTELVNKLTPALAPQALEAIQKIKYPSSRARSLLALADKLPEVIPIALEAAQAIEDTNHRVYALIELADKLPEVIPIALEAIQDIQYELQKSRALIKLADKVPNDLLVEILSIASAIQDETARVQVLSTLVDKLPKELLSLIITEARCIQYESGQAHVLITLIEKLPIELLPQIQDAALTIKNEITRVQILIALADKLPEALSVALTEAQAIQNEGERVQVLFSITEKFPQVISDILISIKGIESEGRKAQLLSALAEFLPDSETELLQQVLDTTQSFENEKLKADVLSAVVTRLPQSELELLQQALDIAQDIEDEEFKFTALSAVIAYLPASGSELLQQTLDAARNIEDEGSRAASISLGAVVARLPKSEEVLIQQALEIALTIRAEKAKAFALNAVANQLSREQIPDFLEISFKLSGKNAAKALAPIAINFPEELAFSLPSYKLSTVLNVVQHFKQDSDRVKFLSVLATQLQFVTGLFPNVLRLISTINQDMYRAELLANIIPYLPNHQLSRGISLVQEVIGVPSIHQVDVIENLIPYLPTDLLPKILDYVEQELVEHPEFQARVLKRIATSIDTLHVNSNENCQEQELIKRIVEKTFELTVKIIGQNYENHKSDILTTLISKLSESQQEFLLSNIEQIIDRNCRIRILNALVVCCSSISITSNLFNEKLDLFIEELGKDSLLKIKVYSFLPSKCLEAVDLAKTIRSKRQRAEAWVEIAINSGLADAQIQAIQVIRDLNTSTLKAQYLQRLIPSLQETELLEAANLVRDIQEPYYRVRAFIALSCRFPEFRIEAKAAAQALENPVHCIEQLSILAVEVPEILPDIIDIAERIKDPFERREILFSLAPHLPMRINREVNREHLSGCPITDNLWERAFYLLARSYRNALQGGSLRNESLEDKDFLNLQDEINALSDLLLMRDLTPPMTIGILGGWGGGKSYIMHLMHTHITRVRSRSVAETEAWNTDPRNEKLSPYVGHIYQIKFDAWTFAKSDLWASLMQTIFFELDRQISLEQQLAQVLAENPEDATSRAKVLCENGQYWSVLYEASEEDRRWFLERVLSPEQLKQFKEIRNQGQFSDELWRQLGASYREENEQLQKLEKELQNKKNVLKQQKQAIRSRVDNDTINRLINKLTGPVSILLSNRISKPVFERLNREISGQVKIELNSDVAAEMAEPIDIDHLKLMVQVAATKVFENRYEEISFHSFLSWFQKNLRLFGVLSSFLILSILLPISVDWVLSWLLPTMDTFFPKLIAFLAPLAPGVASAQALLKRSQKWFEETNLALKEYEKQLETIPKQLEERREQIFQAQLERVKEVAELETEIKALEAKVEAQRQRIPENVYESLEAFVSDRIQSGGYDKHLGLMQQVKGDLAELSRRLLPPAAASQEFQWKVEQLQKIFPRGPARVVVYIDDLDRCPPDRVVQVLEAVQLLVKTPLFIAVLAIDERYITRALEKFYEGVLSRRGRPSGTDYLEKIIQLPYRVRPIMADTLESYLRSQVVIQDSATGGAKFSEFSRQEFNMLLACC
ncbi:hypothetical protein IQ268_31500 [Oculatella sp. LEGE 06141]|uniref:P-loop NTPase fold protein n=1 Tax=Oculatella sp. LEGE 06141 TaxID=1828648 RepID=UPI0018820CAF|nr:P-loop NTPase fold protein [Oculatella sp. LEGE 06141]MBE9183063.1 hypothetical protein [Oculatella sp. LEGE 06141]